MEDKYKELLKKLIAEVEFAHICAIYDTYSRADLTELVNLAKQAKEALDAD